MLYRRFGKTELKMPVLSMGGMRFKKLWEGPAGEIPEETLEQAEALVRYCLQVGMNHFETAKGYGKSEAVYGRVFQRLGLPRDRYLVTTKIGPTRTYDEMRRHIDESLQNLQLDFIDNFDLHGINTPDDLAMTLQKGGCLDAVRDAMKEGLIRHLGFSTHGETSLILEALLTREFESVNLHYYFFYPTHRPAVELAAHLDLGVFIISPTEKGGFLWNPPEKLRRLCHPLSAVEMNDRWLLSQPAVHTLSCGASEPAHIDQHLGALRPGPIPDAVDREVFQRLEAERNRSEDFCTQCQKCLPCPEDIRIPEVLRMRSQALDFDMTDFASWRYSQMRAGDRWYGGRFGDACTACGDCLPRCPMELDIPRLMHDTHARLYRAKK